jgi:hypothetical protein
MGFIFIAHWCLWQGITNLQYLLIFAIFYSPLFITIVYLIFRFLVPVTGGMPMKGFKRWALLYPFAAGYFLSWAILALIFDTYLPFLDRSDRETTLPILTQAAVVLLVSLTRLRYPVNRFINRVFKMENEPDKQEGISQHGDT